MKVSLSFWLRSSEEINAVGMVSFSSGIICTDITAIVFSFHFIFLIASTSDRLGNLIENFELTIASQTAEIDSINALDALMLAYSTFEMLIQYSACR
jgi:hypothetical protein